MQSDRTNKIFSILKNTPDSLVIKSNDAKFIRRTFILKQSSLKLLIERQKLSHPNLINLYHIQFSHFISQDQFAVQIIYEHYCRTLDQCLPRQYTLWEDDEIMNTFQPILDVVEYLKKEKQVFTEFSLKNVVITEAQDIKFLDDFFLQKEINHLSISNDSNNFNQHKIYDKVAETIFSLLYPAQSSRSWKNRMKILKDRSSKEIFTFFSSILSKSLSKGCEIGKTKKIKKNTKLIKKENNEDLVGKTSKQDKKDKDCMLSCEMNFYGKHQGKQNKLQQ